MNLKGKLILTSIALLLLSIPVTMYVLGRQQESRSHATASTTLSFVPTTPVSAAVGDNISFDVQLTPGTNLVTFVRLHVLYDPTVLQLSTTNPFDRNTDAFPTKIEGPIFASGSLIESISTGSDPTKVIVAPTIVGKINFKVIGPTGSTPSTITFGNKSMALSSGAGDQASENVLSTTVPASVIAIGPSAAPTIQTPTPMSAPTGTATPSSTPTSAPTSMITPTLAPPTATLMPGTRLDLSVIIHGIGIGGDNVNPTGNSLSNKNPLNPIRSTSVYVYNSSNQLITTLSGNIQYDSVNGIFTGAIEAGHSIPTGVYTLKIKTDHALIRRIGQIISITADQVNTIPTATMVAGDVNNDNALNILDYNLIFECYSDYSVQPAACTPAKKIAADTNDDGSVNGTDYNLFVRELANQSGD